MQPVSDSLTLTATSMSENLNLITLSATVESLAPSKETTSTGKSPTCNPSTHKPKSSKTSVVDLISKEKDCKPYWSDLCEVISSRLLLPVGIDYADSALNSLNSWQSKTVGKSWFSATLFTAQSPNSQRIFSPSFTSSVAECTGLENTVKKSKKIRICLNPIQKALLKQWFGVSRYVYNQTIAYLQQPGTKANWKAIKGEILAALPDFSSSVPYQIKSIAIKDACKAVSNAKKKFGKDGVFSKMGFRSRKDPIQSCYIPKSAVKAAGIYHTILGEIRYKESLPKSFGDCRLVLAYGDYYLTVPEDVPRQKTDNQGRVVALDPGIRTFMTYFGETGFGWLGDAANMRIQKLCFKLDNLISEMSKAKSAQKKRMKKAASRRRGKIKNLVDEMHKKVARFLVDNFDVILLPSFETSQMASKAKRRIRAKSVRQMLTLSHYQFKEFLKHKAFETGKIVLEVNEAYTSKTVSWTGEIVRNLGGAKVIKASNGQTMNRDLNGARGIFLRALVDTPWLREYLNLCVC